MTLLTVGHGTSTADQFKTLLNGAGVELVVDIRTAPGSRRSPHFARQSLEEWLPAAAIRYRWEPRLGGWRRPRPVSPNIGLENAGFRGYADHMGTDDFRQALDELLVEARSSLTTVMCSESLWWKCHRRILADAVELTSDLAVVHLLPDGRQEPHRLTDSARSGEEAPVVYDVGTTPRLPGVQ